MEGRKREPKSEPSRGEAGGGREQSEQCDRIASPLTRISIREQTCPNPYPIWVHFRLLPYQFLSTNRVIPTHFYFVHNLAHFCPVLTRRALAWPAWNLLPNGGLALDVMTRMSLLVLPLQSARLDICELTYTYCARRAGHRRVVSRSSSCLKLSFPGTSTISCAARNSTSIFPI